MNTTLIMLPQPILVSMKEPIVERSNDCFYSFETSKIYSCKEFHSAISCYKIIAGIEGLPILDLSAIAEKIGWVDVEKLAEQQFPNFELILKEDWHSIKNGFVDGFKAAQSLNEKKFTLSEMEQCWLQAQECVLGTDDFPMGGNNFKYPSFKEYIQSLSKPKEYNIECIKEGNTIKVTKILS